MRRITKRRIAEGESAKIADAISGADRVGVLDGVAVDFRHSELPPADWEPLPQWAVCGPPPIHAGVLFPGEAAHLPDPAKDLTEFAYIEAREGDRLTIESVVPEIGDRRFDHPHDAQFRRAYLRLERPSGEVLRPSGPLAFFGTTRIKEAPTREAFDHILERICRHRGVASVYTQGVNGECVGAPSWDMPLEELAQHFGAQAHDAYFRLLALVPDRGNATGHLRRFANSAALAGFLLGKVEARQAERAGSGPMSNLSKATDANTRTDWRDRAKELWAANPHWTTHRVAKIIADEDGVAEVRSVSRSIETQGCVPATSPSYKKA